MASLCRGPVLLLLVLGGAHSTLEPPPDLITEVLAAHQFHFNEAMRPTYCDPLGEVVFHANSNPKLKGYTLKLEVPSSDWSVTVTEVLHQNRTFRVLYTNFIVEAVVECLNNNETSGCIRADPPMNSTYLRTTAAALSIAPGVKKASVSWWGTPQPKFKRVLLGGLGAGILPRYFDRYFPDYIVDVVEILPIMVETVQSDLGLNTSRRINIIVDDVVHYVATTKKRYDIVLIDISGTDTDKSRVLPPPALSTRPFLENCRRVMTDDGIFVQHLWKVSYARPNYDAYTTVAHQIWDEWYYLDGGSSWLAVATASPKSIEPSVLAEAAGEDQRERHIPLDVVDFSQALRGLLGPRSDPPPFDSLDNVNDFRWVGKDEL